MFSKKLIVIAAAVALALGASTADAEYRVRVHAKRHHHKQAPKCGADESPMSVEGVEGAFCVKGQACVAQIDGACPVPQKGLEFGAYCDEVKTGVMGCKPYKSMKEWEDAHGDEESEEVDDECADDETEMSVEGVEGVFCVSGQACVATTNGTCPEPQEGLEFGAYCGEVKTGVMGCKPYKSMDEWPKHDHHHHHHHHHHHESGEVEDGECNGGDDESPMSVEGVEGVFCVKGQACVADIDGACPIPQEGLEFGAYCDEVKTGVMGCKPYGSWEEWEKDHPEDDSDDDSEESEEVDDECDDDETEMSVEGVEGIFCVKGQACVANTNGTCPEPQEGLEFGAYCGEVKTGVLGCKPYKSEAERKAGPPKKKHHAKFVKGHSKKVVKAHGKKVHH
ncbi:hypothetical protein P43SY_004164 [Pythium insidiosum]|uniref:Cysteine-rich protein n=1 Tax=Pythium insidiosum TaxID=114742 RepID=A0AAD5Q1T4_PYTIN|nr:hypothetical protein P43SY_004164 [Pythium insidiosum]